MLLKHVFHSGAGNLVHKLIAYVIKLGWLRFHLKNRKLSGGKWTMFWVFQITCEYPRDFLNIAPLARYNL